MMWDIAMVGHCDHPLLAVPKNQQNLKPGRKFPTELRMYPADSEFRARQTLDNLHTVLARQNWKPGLSHSDSESHKERLTGCQ
jgi:hypothetical protein